MSSKNYNDNLYTYEILADAIDFFTQKFDLQQLAQYAFNFFYRVLSLKSSALFLKQENQFVQVKTTNFAVSDYTISDTERIQRVATLYGHVLISNFETYFPEEVIRKFNVQLIIPLIIHDSLIGFILSDGKNDGAINQRDYAIADTVARLVNHSLENTKNCADLRQTNANLDQKIFNLFTVHHCSKALVAELDLDKLYSLATDVFSEIACSKVTSFGLYDEIAKKIIIRGYKNVTTFKKYYDEFELYDDHYTDHQIVLHYEKDIEKIKNIFVNWRNFKYLDTEYIILIVKKKILGFVTISKSINEREYDSSLFELIDSLATSTYISLSNAMLFLKLKHQNLLNESKYKTLSKLNMLVKNIKNCADFDELCNVSIKTLEIAFGIQKAFIAFRSKNILTIKESIGFQTPVKQLEINKRWYEIDKTGTMHHFHSDHSPRYFTKDFLENIGENNCLVISPINVESFNLDEHAVPLGYIVVLQSSQNLKEELPLLIDTIASNIAPIIKHMYIVEQIKTTYLVNQRERFMHALKTKIFVKKRYFINFYIYYKRILQKPFNDPDLTPYHQYEYYYFDNILFVLSEILLDEDLFDGKTEADSLDELINIVNNE
ncbi:MAG: hypothetical protein MJB12_03405 [Firmicutes bacterium]|nr:hypothetical protein [Bacillota bacterium]